jgi:hypothetical protein
MFHNCKNTDMICYSSGRFIYLLTDKVDESEKTTGPSGVEPSM